MRNCHATAGNFVAALSIFLISCGGGGDSSAPQSLTAARSDPPNTARVASVAPRPITTETFSKLDANVKLNALVDERIANDPASSHFFQAVKEAGGINAFNQLLLSGESARIRDLLAKHGIGWDDASIVASKVAEPQAIGDCVQFFPPEDRNKVFALGAQVSFIDAEGRPGYAVWTGGPTTPIVEQKRSTCQTTIGSWGLAGDQGGHLAPHSLGGWPGRANIVPQNGKMNQSTWKTVESVPIKCRLINPTIYTVVASYATALDIRPFSFSVNIILNTANFGTQTGGIVNMPNQYPVPEMDAAARAFVYGSTPFC